jgi:hypothetical protein
MIVALVVRHAPSADSCIGLENLDEFSMQRCAW